MFNDNELFVFSEFVIEETVIVNKLSMRDISRIFSSRDGWCMEQDKKSGLTLFYR